MESEGWLTRVVRKSTPQIVRSSIIATRDYFTEPIEHADFFATGQIGTKDFEAAGDYLTSKFPSWQWYAMPEFHNPVAKLDVNKHVLRLDKGVKCHDRLQNALEGSSAPQETTVVVGDGFRDGVNSGATGGDEEGWIKTADLVASEVKSERGKDVRTLDDSGNLGEIEPDESDDIPDMDVEDDDPDALPFPDHTDEDENNKHRMYEVYICYSPFDRTPRMYLSGKEKNGNFLPPPRMMEDVMGDYHGQTVTVESFPHQRNGARMVAIHPCKHAAVMKVLMQRANNALKRRREKLRLEQGADDLQGKDGLAGDMDLLKLSDGVKHERKGNAEDEWEVVDTNDDPNEDEVAIRADQYLVVFLKFMASVIPNIEIDNTMAI